MDWKKYENEIFENFKTAYPNAKISYNQKIVGRYSKTERQIDVLIEGRLAGKKLRLVIDGKYYSKNVDVKAVDSFISMVEDIDAVQGILITSKGYSPAAINRAYYGPTDIELDILNFDELKEFQGFGGLTYSGWHGALIPAPFGWIVDRTQRMGSIANLYQRGITYEKARENGEYIYFNILSFDENLKNLDDVLKYHEQETLEYHPAATFEYFDTVEREDEKKTLLRKILRKETDLEEYTGFVEFDDFCVFCVLFTPEQLKNKNIRKLEYVIERLHPLDIDLESVAIGKIGEYESLIKKAESTQEKADLLINIAEVHRDMKRNELAIKKYEESIAMFPDNYGATLALLEMSTEDQNRDELTESLFNLDPGNPMICDDLARYYFETDKTDLIIKFFKDKASKYLKDESINGNIQFILGVIHYENSGNKEALTHLKKANELLKKSLKSDNNIFTVLGNMIKELEN